MAEKTQQEFIYKRDGEVEKFASYKIEDAIKKAYESVGKEFVLFFMDFEGGKCLRRGH